MNWESLVCYWWGILVYSRIQWKMTVCSILKSTILLSTWYELSFLFGLFTIFSWIIRSLILSWRCSLLVFSKSIVFQVIINLVQISAFMLLLQMINNNKNIVVKNGKIDICNGNCCHSNCFEIINLSDWKLCNLYRLRKCRRDCKTIQMKVIKYYRKPLGSCHLHC